MKSDWEIKKLGEVCDIFNGLWKGKKPPYVEVGVIRNTNFKKDGFLDDSEIAYLPVEIKQYEQKKLKFGDIILEKSGGGPKQPVGRIALFKKMAGEFSFSNFTSAIRILNKNILNFNFLHRFLYFKYISGETELMQRRSTGIRNLQLKEYKEIEIPIPPLSEQKRIVKILDGVFENIERAKENTEKNLQNARELFESYLQSVFANPGEEWEEKKLGEVCDISIGKTPARGNKRFWDEKRETNNVWLSIRDLNNINKKEVFDSREYISNSGAKLCKKVKKGTLLASFKLTLGRLAFTGIDLYTNEAIASLDIKNSKTLNKEYLYYYLTFFDWHAETKGDVKVKGKTLNKAKLKEMQVLIPPLSEQKRIVGRLDALSEEVKKLEQAYQQKLDNLEELKKSILKQAFSGELAGVQ